MRTGDWPSYTLLRQREHLKYGYRNVSKKFHHLGPTHAALATEQIKSAVADHAITLNHVLDQDHSKVVNRESNKVDRWIKVVDIRKEQDDSMNRDEVLINFVLSMTNK